MLEWSPSQAQKPISLPPDFFNLTPEELKREQELKSDLAEQQLMLRTKGMNNGLPQIIHYDRYI